MSVKLSSRQCFTLASANRMLPLIRVIVGDIVELFQDLKGREERLGALREGHDKSSSPVGLDGDEIRADLEKDVEKLQGFVEELQELGVDFKDPVLGLIDFPAIMDNQEVCLCWRLGEPAIVHWHARDAGYSERQTIDPSAWN